MIVQETAYQPKHSPSAYRRSYITDTVRVRNNLNICIFTEVTSLTSALNKIYILQTTLPVKH